MARGPGPCSSPTPSGPTNTWCSTTCARRPRWSPGRWQMCLPAPERPPPSDADYTESVAPQQTELRLRFPFERRTPTMASNSFSEFCLHVLEQMSAPPDIQVRRMLGGYGLFRSGLMFAVVLKDELYFKADEVNVGRFQARGLPPFSYEA